LNRTLVTGAAGFIGSHLVEQLLAAGEEVVGLDNFDPFYAEAVKRDNLKSALEQSRYHFERVDIRDQARVEAILRGHGITRVAHLAARAGVRPSLQDPQGYIETNVAGTAAILQAAQRAEVSSLVFASSSSVYGADAAVPFREEAPTDHPASPYAATKKAGEAWCYCHHHLTGMPVTCLRFFTVYGPRQRPDLAIHQFTRRIDRGQPIRFFGDGSSRRDYTFVDDTVAGICAALDRPDGFQVYNLGRSDPIALRDLVTTLEGALGKEALLERCPDQPGDVPITCADTSKAQRDLGYHPQVDFPEGVRRFVAWYLERKEEQAAVTR
jgi:UDP-glucuronate 4-epimerase